MGSGGAAAVFGGNHIHEQAIKARPVHPLEGGEADVGGGGRERMADGGEEEKHQTSRYLGGYDAADQAPTTKEQRSGQNGDDLSELREREGIADLRQCHVQVPCEVDGGQW